MLEGLRLLFNRALAPVSPVDEPEDIKTTVIKAAEELKSEVSGLQSEIDRIRSAPDPLGELIKGIRRRERKERKSV